MAVNFYLETYNANGNNWDTLYPITVAEQITPPDKNTNIFCYYEENIKLNMQSYASNASIRTNTTPEMRNGAITLSLKEGYNETDLKNFNLIYAYQLRQRGTSGVEEIAIKYLGGAVSSSPNLNLILTVIYKKGN